MLSDVGNSRDNFAEIASHHQKFARESFIEVNVHQRVALE